MGTENDKTKQKKLTPRQRNAIAAVIACPSYSAAAEKAGISRSTLYRWLDEPDFRAELDHQRDRMAEQASLQLLQATSRAVTVLCDLLDDDDPRVRRLAAQSILNYALQTRELIELTRRIEAVEDSINQPEQ